MKTKKNETKAITTEELDRKFDAGEDISDYVDWNQGIRKVNVDMPLWMIKELDKEATRQGINRQALVKTWLTAKLDEIRNKKAS